MEEVKKWSVTYTKQINKKAKVYHDGILELHSLKRKVILYDDCQNVLDSRFVKKEDLIKLDETLKFDSYLVDTGDLHGDVKVSTKFNIPPTATNATRTPESFQTPRFDRKPYLGKQNTRTRNLSPSQKIIREFKRSEISKRSLSPGSFDTRESGKTEWEVLYTTQVTQKAKKYQDGFLQLLLCGSKGNQVILYDTTRRLLVSRFLKNDEVIRSGEFVAFDGYLVDVGECKENHEPAMKLNRQGIDCDLLTKTKAEAVSDRIFSPNQSLVGSCAEWEANYTTQLTQKTKKYNSGTLKLAASGSYHKQVTLLSDEGTILSRRFLQTSENLRAGSTLRVQNYLVELGEPRTSLVELGEPWTSLVELGESRASAKEFQKTGSSLKGGDSSQKCYMVEDIRSQKSVPTNGPARGVLEILSILKKPMAQKNLTEVERRFPEEGRPIADKNGQNTNLHQESNHTIKAEAVDEVLIMEVSKQEIGETLSGFSDGSGCISNSEIGIDGAKTSITFSDLSAVEPEVLAGLECSPVVQQLITPKLEDSPAEIEQMGICSESTPCTDGRPSDSRWASGVNLTDIGTLGQHDINIKDMDAFPNFELGF